MKTKTRYPNLDRIVELIYEEHEHRVDWSAAVGWLKVGDLAKLEKQAAKLTDEEKQALVYGDPMPGPTDFYDLIDKKKVKALSDWVGEACAGY